MQIREKLKVMRQLKDLTQEELAEKIGYSVNGYAKIERGESDVSMSNLEKIAQVLGIDLHKLLGLNDANVFYMAENCNYNGSIVLTEAQCTHELEKSRLAAQEKDKEIDYLKNENALLKEMVTLLKNQENPLNKSANLCE